MRLLILCLLLCSCLAEEKCIDGFLYRRFGDNKHFTRVDEGMFTEDFIQCKEVSNVQESH